MEKLKKMQKPAGIQIDERIDARIEGKMNSTVADTVWNILADNLNPMAFKNKGSKNKKKHKSRSGNKKHKSGHNNQVILQTVGNNATAPIMPAPIIITANTLPTQSVQPTQSGTTNDGHNIQYVTVPVDQLPFLSFNTNLRLVEVFTEVRLVAHLEEEVDVEGAAEDLPEIKVSFMLIVWMLLLLTFLRTR